LQLEYRNGGSWRYDCSRPKKTFDFLEGLYAPKVKLGPKLHIGNIKNRYGRCFDSEVTINAADIEPMITYGTNPGMGLVFLQLFRPLVKNKVEPKRIKIFSVHGFWRKRCDDWQTYRFCFLRKLHQW
jgi:hypothetical protein